MPNDIDDDPPASHAIGNGWTDFPLRLRLAGVQSQADAIQLQRNAAMQQQAQTQASAADSAEALAVDE